MKKIASPAENAMIKFIAEAAHEINISEHAYIVGGAPRDFALGNENIKEL